MTACNDFIDVPPTGVVDGDLAYSQPDKMVNAAYASLGDCWYSYPFNLWPYGDLGNQVRTNTAAIWNCKSKR